MVAAPLSYPAGQRHGPRPVNLRKDVPQVLMLLNLAFRNSLDGEESRSLNSTSLSQQPWLVLRLRQLSRGVVPGFVWEESGDIVGNVTLLTTRIHGRFLVANVAVHPDFRRQGIARNLMEMVVESVGQSGGRELLLQVRHDNEAAVGLYESLNFQQLGSMTSWYASFRQFRLLPSAGTDQSDGAFIRPLRGSEWQDAYRIDAAAVHPSLNWPEPLTEDHYKRGFWRWLSRLISGKRVESWAAEDKQGMLKGLASITSEWGRLHTLSLRVRSDARGTVEQALLAKLLRRLQHTYRRNIRMDHPVDDDIVSDLMRQANFVPRRTLTTMIYRFPAGAG